MEAKYQQNMNEKCWPIISKIWLKGLTYQHINVL